MFHFDSVCSKTRVLVKFDRFYTIMLSVSRCDKSNFPFARNTGLIKTCFHTCLWKPTIWQLWWNRQYMHFSLLSPSSICSFNFPSSIPPPRANNKWIRNWIESRWIGLDRRYGNYFILVDKVLFYSNNENCLFIINLL